MYKVERIKKSPQTLVDPRNQLNFAGRQRAPPPPPFNESPTFASVRRPPSGRPTPKHDDPETERLRHAHASAVRPNSFPPGKGIFQAEAASPSPPRSDLVAAAAGGGLVEGDGQPARVAPDARRRRRRRRAAAVPWVPHRCRGCGRRRARVPVRVLLPRRLLLPRP